VYNWYNGEGVTKVFQGRSMKQSTKRRDEGPFKVGDAARHCRVSRFTVLKWVRDGKLKSYTTPGGHHRIERDDLLDFLKKFGLPVPPALQGNRPPRVLIVDDEPSVTDFLSRALRTDPEGEYEVLTTQSGYDACILVGEKKPDLVVLDIKMPGIDGFEVCRRIRSNPATQSTEIIAITGYPSEENVRAIRDAGARVCLAKPVEIPEFRSTVREVLGVPRE
jgi:excisionase family DNA binding protein